MTEQELQEIFELLEKSGMNPQLCDTPVPFYENAVPAGIPTDPGDVVQGEYIMLPRSLVKWEPVFIVKVVGDSMNDAGIMPGDRLHVQIDAEVRDGDIVVVSIDGDCMVKAFCTDEQGQAWLVPRSRNPKYFAKRLTEGMNVRILGKVVECIKDAPRATFTDCLDAIKRAQDSSDDKKATIRERMAKAVMAVAASVEYKRLWYAVYRAMLDRKAVGEDDYVGFVELVTEIVPDHPHLPSVTELRRMAVQSFRKPVARWERDDAPVSGGRFDAYRRIAKMTAEILKG